MAKRKLNVAMIGYDFMGRAHSNAWRQVGAFFQDAAVRAGAEGRRRPHRGEGQGGGGAPRLGGARDELAGGARAQRHRRRRHLHAGRLARADRDRRRRGGQGDPLREAARQHASPKPSACTPPSRRPASSTWSATTTAAARRWRWPSSSSTRASIGDIHHYRGIYLQDWIVDPEFPRVWRLEKAKAGLGLARRHPVALDGSVALPGRRAGRGLRPARRRSSTSGRCPRTRAGAARSTSTTRRWRSCVRERRHRLLRGHALRARPQELQPLRDQRHARAAWSGTSSA